MCAPQLSCSDGGGGDGSERDGRYGYQVVSHLLMSPGRDTIYEKQSKTKYSNEGKRSRPTGVPKKKKKNLVESEKLHMSSHHKSCRCNDILVVVLGRGLEKSGTFCL